MTNSKYEEEVGPTAVITFSSQGSMTGYFEGYLESIGYKSYGKLVLGKVNHMDRSQRVMFQQDKQNERFADSLDQSVLKKGFKLFGYLKRDDRNVFTSTSFEVNLCLKFCVR